MFCLFFYSFGVTGEVALNDARLDKQHQKIFSDSLLNIKIDSLRILYNKSDFKYGGILKNALDLYELVKSTDNPELKYKSNLLLGDILDRTNNYKESLLYFKLALTNVLSNLDKELIDNRDYSNYGNTLLRLGRIYEKLGRNDSARVCYDKVDSIPILTAKIENLKAVAYGNISGLLQRDSLFKDAEKFSLKAVSIHKKLNNKLNLSYSLNYLGSLYLSQGYFTKSKNIYEQGINVLLNDNSEPAVRSKANLYYNLAWAMYNLKEYKAYDYQEKYYIINDRIRDNNFRQIVEEVKAKHNVDLVKKQAQIRAAEASKKNWIIMLSGMVLIFLLLFFLISYNLRQKNMSLKLRQQESEQEKILSDLKAESQALILNAALDGKESERKEIAETLHDNVSTLLSSANLHLQACKTQFNGNTPVEVDKTQIIINEASQKIRDLSHTLVSSILLKFGLSFAVNDMIKKYSNSQISIEGDIEELPRFNQKFEIKVYNIVQELVNNILKHSDASTAFIGLTEQEGKLRIQINDNGKGFDKTKITVKDGLGINQIDARIQMMKGKFDIDSKMNHGTKIDIELPIYEVSETKAV